MAPGNPKKIVPKITKIIVVKYKKIFKIKVVGVKNKIQPHLFMLRSIILTNFIPNLVSIIVLILGTKEMWLSVNNVVVYINYFISFIIIGFMIFREDERGLHDILCDTEVIDLKLRYYTEEDFYAYINILLFS
mgnify:CR=1 FL=1